MVSATGWTDTLIGLLEKQQAIYLQLQVFSRRQAELIAAADASGLLSLLDERQHLIDQLLSISREIEPFRQRWPALWASLDEPTRQLLKTHMDGVQAMLDQILQQDERDRAALVAHRQNISRQLSAVNRGASAHRIYRSAAATSRPAVARFTDQQG